MYHYMHMPTYLLRIGKFLRWFWEISDIGDADAPLKCGCPEVNCKEQEELKMCMSIG